MAAAPPPSPSPPRTSARGHRGRRPLAASAPTTSSMRSTSTAGAGGPASSSPAPPPPGAAESVTVAFPITREVITVPRHYVRPRRDYVGGEWVPSQTAIAIQPARAVRVYEAGEKIEAVRDREPYGSSWFPATVAKAVDGLSYVVEYSDEEEEGDKVMEYLHWQYIRPAVERHWAWEDGFQIAPGSAVEAYCNGAWSPGVVRGMSGEGDEYEVIVNGKEAEQVVIKVLELLRPRHEWDESLERCEY
ncbi:protein AGENET DOMAIN (AGD)-CONTAINING P1-like isoform X1 [Panicum virgatum]|nr:protein AGENET DOMAIN (AGD)-CONTAINING P1-like isoform X1 [Panicum virgatum]